MVFVFTQAGRLSGKVGSKAHRDQSVVTLIVAVEIKREFLDLRAEW